MIEDEVDVSSKMNVNSKMTFITDVIKRYDNYIISTNAKASLIIAFNSLIIGTVLLKFSDIMSFYNFSDKFVVGLLLFLIASSSLLSLFFVFSVVYPYFNNNNSDEHQEDSLVFFGSVSKLKSQDYLNRLNVCSTDDLVKDLVVQATILANGLNLKMLRMRQSIKAITCSLIFILFIVILRAFCWLCN